MHMLANIGANAPEVSGVMFGDALGFFVFLIIVAVSSFFQWLKNKNNPDEWSTPGSPGQPSPGQQPRRAVDWEEELKRMLEGETTSPPSRPSSPMPPVIPPQPRHVSSPMPPPLPPVHRPIPKPQPQPQPTVVAPKPHRQPRMYKGHCESCDGHIEFPSNMLGDTIVCPHCMAQTTLSPFIETRVDQLQHKTELTAFKESILAHKKASSLEQSVSARLEDVTKRPVKSTQAETHRIESPEIKGTIALLRSPRTARQAIIASVILGQPKGMES